MSLIDTKLLSAVGQIWHARDGLDDRFIQDDIYYIESVNESELYSDVFDADVEDGEIQIEISAIRNVLNTTFVDECIIVKYPKPHTEYWYGERRPWFNIDRTKLGFVSSRSYISIEVPYQEVKLDNQLKGANLTVEDVLFATRALIGGSGWYNIGGYTSMTRENNILTIYKAGCK